MCWWILISSDFPLSRYNSLDYVIFDKTFYPHLFLSNLTIIVTYEFVITGMELFFPSITFYGFLRLDDDSL